MANFKTKFSRAKKRQIAEYYVYNNSTIRKTAEHFGIAKSYIHQALVEFQQDRGTAGTYLALKVAEQCSRNVQERARRGGQITKAKYSKKQK